MIDYPNLSHADLVAAVQDLDARLTGAGSCNCDADVVFTPKDSHSTDPSKTTLGADVNAAADMLLAANGGGKITIDGRGVKMFFERPIDNRGVTITCAGLSAPAGRTRTRLQPLFSHDAQLRQHEAPEDQGVQHWRSGSFSNVTLVNPLNRPGLASLQILGGNWAPIRRVAQQHSVEYHIVVTDGYKSSGQFSVIEDFFGWAATRSLIATRGPDIKFVRPVLYGRNQGEADRYGLAPDEPNGPEPGSVGVNVEGDSYIFDNPDVQFFETSWRVNAKHVLVHGGATELGQFWAPGSARTVIELGPDAQWVVIGAGHSFAHLDKVQKIAGTSWLDVVKLTSAPADLKFEILKPFGLAAWQLDPAVRWCVNEISRRQAAT